MFIQDDEILTEHAKELSCNDEEVQPVTQGLLLRHCEKYDFAVESVFFQSR